MGEQASFLTTFEVSSDPSGRSSVEAHDIYESDIYFAYLTCAALNDVTPGITIEMSDDTKTDENGRKRDVRITYPSPAARAIFEPLVSFAKEESLRLMSDATTSTNWGVVEGTNIPVFLTFAATQERDVKLKDTIRQQGQQMLAAIPTP